MSKPQLTAQLNAIKALADTIQEAGSIPSGHLYAAFMPVMSLEFYNSCLGVLKRTGLVSESNHLLTWKLKAEAAA